MTMEFGVLIITCCFIYMILILCGVNMYIKNKQHKDKMEIEILKIKEQEKTKLEMLRVRLDFEREKLNRELSNAISENHNINFKAIMEDIDVIIKSVIEPQMRLKCIKNNKPLDNLSFDDIIIPITEKEHTSDIEQLNKMILDNMPSHYHGILNKYLNFETAENMVKNMIKIYYFDVLQNLRALKSKLAEKDNEIYGAKQSLFIGGRLNSSVDLTKEQMSIIMDLNIKSIKELEVAQNTLRNDTTGMYDMYKPLLDINIENYK